MRKMFLRYLITIVIQLNQFTHPLIWSKLKASFNLALLVGPLVFIYDSLFNWTIINSAYILVVLTAIAVDHMLGSLKHAFWTNDFSTKLNLKGLFIKLSIVITGGFLFEGLNVIVTHDTIIKDYLIIVTRLIVFLYPAGSAFASMSVITGGKFPPKEWLDRLKRFNKNLDPNDLTKRKKDENKDDTNI